jgi:HEAT repeat
VTAVDVDGFARLSHAYGPATDTAGHLAALLDGDESARSAAMEHLWSAVIHQGTPWTATPPAALAVAGFLADPRLSGEQWAELRANLVRFLAAVARACQQDEKARLNFWASPADRDVDAEVAALAAAGEDSEWDETLANAMYARAVLGCHEVIPTVLDASMSMLSDPDPRVRSAAAEASTACCRVLGRSPQSLADELSALVASAGPDERASLVLAIGELGTVTREYLTDPHPGVRACAALAPAMANDDAATTEILAGLADPAACDSWFTDQPPQLRFRIRFALVAAAVERVDEFERLLPAALAIAGVASKYTVDFDWGRLLLTAFKGGTPDADALSEPQRRYLAALVDNPDLWDPQNGNASLIFQRAGLPYDQQACRALLSNKA